MKKIAIYLESPVYNNDAAVLSAYLNAVGIECRIFFRDICGKTLADKIVKFAPEYIVSTTEFRAHGGSGELKEACEEAVSLKMETGIKTVLFGRQATIAGEMILNRFSGLDYIIVGDPEYPLEKLINAGPQAADGLIYRNRDNKVVVNPVGAQTDLSKLPRPDFDSFFGHKEAANMGYFIPVSRGCLYRCAFCQNARISEITKTQKISPRFYPVHWIIDNLLYIKEKFGPIANFYFTDTNFTFSKEFLREFIKLYTEKINVPFVAATRANLVDGEVAGLLKRGGCSKVSFGTESGDEDVRNKVIKKGLKDADIKKCVDLLKQNGIRMQTNVIVGLPGDDFNAALDSVIKAMRFKTDIMNVSIFQPYFGTELTEKAIKDGYLDEDFTKWECSEGKQYGKSALKIKDIKKIENLQLLAPLIKAMPYRPLLSMLSGMPKNRIYFGIYHMQRVMRSLKYEVNNEPFIYRAKYFWGSIARIFIQGKRPNNR